MYLRYRFNMRSIMMTNPISELSLVSRSIKTSRILTQTLLFVDFIGADDKLKWSLKGNE